MRQRLPQNIKKQNSSPICVHPCPICGKTSSALDLPLQSPHEPDRSPANEKLPLVQPGPEIHLHLLRKLLHRRAGICLDQRRRNPPACGSSSSHRRRNGRTTLPKNQREIQPERNPLHRRQIRLRFSKRNQTPRSSRKGQTIVQAKRVCGIYEVRPLQCRTWPFWPENLENKQAWNVETRKCPGMNTGKHYTPAKIEALRDAKEWPDKSPGSK